jgi:TonB family protein
MANDANDLDRYRRDQMTPGERRAFEMRALEDPFLRDALSGSESLNQDAFTSDVDDLNRQLAQRRTPWFTPIRIAAGIAIVATVGWLFYRTTQVEPESLAELKRDSTSITDSTSKLLTLAAPQKDSATEQAKKEPAESIAKTPALKPSELQPTTTQPAPTSTTSPSASGVVARTEPAKTDLPAETLAKEGVAKIGPTQAESVKTEIAKTEVAEDTQRDKAIRVEQAAPSVLQKRADELKAAERKANVSRAQDVMLDDASQKSEVHVFPSDSSASSSPIVLASPAGGLEAYKRYLEENHRVPDAARTARIRGKVTVGFEVTANGNISGLHVLKSLGYGCDEELLRLVRSGPSWSPTVRSDIPQVSTVWVKLEFVADR